MAIPRLFAILSSQRRLVMTVSQGHTRDDRNEVSERRKLRVLFVDDHSDDLLATTSYLRQLGCAVEDCAGPTKAIETIREFKPHLVLIDLAMPRISGMALVRLIKRMHPSPCLLVARTGHSDAQLHSDCLEAGFNLVMVKPIPTPDLNRLLEAARKFAFAGDTEPSR